MLKLTILGATGRMGQSLVRAAHKSDTLRIVAATEQEGHAALGLDAGTLAGITPIGVKITTLGEVAASDVVIDFTFHAAVPDHAAHAAASGQSYILGTTGLTATEEEAVYAAAKVVPVVWAPNMSLGINLLFDLVERTAALLDDSYDIEIVEMHHRLKRDAPSGTALGLARAAAAGRKVALNEVALYGREGLPGERPRGEIGIHALRGGDVVGDHTVIFAADSERVELTHKASNRESFARGALAAARWLQGRKPGLYTMRHVLGLE